MAQGAPAFCRLPAQHLSNLRPRQQQMDAFVLTRNGLHWHRAIHQIEARCNIDEIFMRAVTHP